MSFKNVFEWHPFVILLHGNLNLWKCFRSRKVILPVLSELSSIPVCQYLYGLFQVEQDEFNDFDQDEFVTEDSDAEIKEQTTEKPEGLKFAKVFLQISHDRYISYIRKQPHVIVSLYNCNESYLFIIYFRN